MQGGNLRSGAQLKEAAKTTQRQAVNRGKVVLSLKENKFLTHTD